MSIYNDGDLLEYVKKYFTYHPDGTITRSDRKNSNGSLDSDGYLIVKIKGKQYKAHRLVYLMLNGHFPDGEIDHINRVKTDNRIENLRVADRSLNVNNTEKKPNPDTGVIGIYLDKSTKGLKKKYTFRRNGKTYRFHKLEDAVKGRGMLDEHLQEATGNSR